MKYLCLNSTALLIKPYNTLANNKLINDATATGISPHPVLQTETGQKPLSRYGKCTTII